MLDMFCVLSVMESTANKVIGERECVFSFDVLYVRET